MKNKTRIALAVAIASFGQTAVQAETPISGLEAAVAAPASPLPATPVNRAATNSVSETAATYGMDASTDTDTFSDVAIPAPISVPTPAPPPLPAAKTATVGALPATQDDLIARLKSFDRVLLRHPDDRAAREGRLLTLSRLGAGDIAIAEAEHYPAVSREVVARLYEERATLAVRWSENTYYAKPGQEYPGYDRAIALAQANLQQYPESLQSRYDLVRALNNRKRRTEAIAIYAALPDQQSDIPSEVHESAGSAYLAEKQPELAEQAFRKAVARKPGNFNAGMGLFYALVDQNRFPEAREHIDTLAEQALLPQDKFSAATAAAFERAFEGHLEVAQVRLEKLQDEAPSSDQLHMALGKVYLWRGWPRRAREQFDMVMQRDPDNLQAGAALVETDASLGNFGAADDRLAQLKAIAPADGDVMNQARAQEVRNYNELTVSLIGTRSSENISSGRGVIVESKLLAKPMWPQLRPFIHEYFERGITSQLSSDYRRLGAGLQYTIANVGVVEAEVQQEFFKNPKTSVALTGDFRLNDQWTVRGRIDSNSLDVPLVARYYDISGWQVGGGVSYRDSERWSVSADVSQLNMSDQNTRRSALVRGAATVIQGPSYKGSVELELYRATNSVANAAYFNPQDSQSVMFSYVSDWNNFQRYNRSFGQRLILSIGRQSEHGFSSATIGGVSYEQRVSVSDTLSLNYGAGYVRRIYSGNISSGPEVHLNLNWKFL